MKYSAFCAITVITFALLSGCEVGIEGSDGTTAAAGQRDGLNRVPPRSGSLEGSAARRRVARGHLRFVEGYQTGFQQAQRDGKPMLLFFTAEWCRFCHQMADEAFTHPQVVGLSEQFVCILIDADLEGSVCRQFQVTGYPTIQFLSSRGAPLERIVGKKPGHQLMMSMQAALQTLARRGDDGADISSR